ncbi:MAG: G1 family glutamic endopeptidase [Vulcanisaeta sp.]
MNRTYIVITVALTIMAIALTITTVSSTTIISHPLIKYYGVKGQVYSLNWAGYAVPAHEYTVTSVAGSFIVPSLTCTKQTTYVALWAGIDGYNDSTVEQAGVLGECSGGKPTYSAWYEFYPSPAVFISGFTVKPGDKIYVNVTYIGNGEFQIVIKDVTENEAYTVTGSVSNALLSSAECILERPTVNGQLTTLANFGTAYFGQDYTNVMGTCYATVSGSTKAFGAFPSVVEIIMTAYNGKILAEPSPLTSDGTSFTVTYVGGK